MLNNIKSPHPLSHKIASETNETNETKQKWPVGFPTDQIFNFSLGFHVRLERNMNPRSFIDQLRVRQMVSDVR